jgi:hypothetical protein
MSIEDHQPTPHEPHPAEKPSQRDYAPYPKPPPVPACDILNFTCPCCSKKKPTTTHGSIMTALRRRQPQLIVVCLIALILLSL